MSGTISQLIPGQHVYVDRRLEAIFVRELGDNAIVDIGGATKLVPQTSLSRASEIAV